ncbi:DUF927 domain-containing protein [Chromatocurvus halotolerans]|uniref:Uncharacterized protein (DUF927 family) n=1 Tax=Chromatocurvus halotolerans TaxID=1132028 RepID=A0A4R2KGX6_9GAMM|nr:DUF927 domain-containing protein [Chromatocurvus halotolerans]TCO69709.1 uncharacterized protein (DUF927 family) [Chromatocurvus halotolerans]
MTDFNVKSITSRNLVAKGSPAETDSQASESLIPLNLTVPEGFELMDNGVYKITPQGQHRLVSGPAWVSAKNRDISGNGWGIHVQWIDQDGVHRERAFPNRQLHERAQSAVISHLADEGLHVIPGQESPLLSYLGSFDTDHRVNSTAQTGWLTDPELPLSYVLPNSVLSSDPDLPIAFQPERFSPSADSLQEKGSLKHWQAQVGRYCGGNPILQFTVCAALTPPLLRFAEMDSFGIHLYGASSQGKTTALQVASSVWGNGSDPAASAQSSIQRWNTTANALEGLAAAHNDGLIALDEMGTFTGFDFGAVVYNLMGGQGKARMNDRGGMRSLRTWRLLALSTGEISIQAKIKESGGKVKAGQVNRFLDVPVTDRIIHPSHDMAPARLADRLKEASGQCYGTLGPAFVDMLIHSAPDAAALAHYIKQLMSQYAALLQGNIQLETHQARALKRFGLICTAARLASDFKLLPWPLEETISAIASAGRTWLSANVGDATRGILAIRDFIFQNQTSKFKIAQEFSSEKWPPVYDIAGYYLPQKEVYAFTSEGFERACAGLDPKGVAATLDKNNLLLKNEPGRLTAKLSIPGVGSRVRLYTVKSNILDVDLAGSD